MPSGERSAARHGEPSPPPEIPPVVVDSPGETGAAGAGADGSGVDGANGTDAGRDPTEPGPTFRLLLSVHGALVIAGVASLVALTVGVRDAATLYVVGGYGWLFSTAGLGGLLFRVGVPTALHPERLYPHRGWLLVALPPLGFGLVPIAAASVATPTPGGTLAAALGALAALPGLLLWVVSRNAVARSLRETRTVEWTGPRSPGRVRELRLLGVAIGAVLTVVSVGSFLRGGPQLFSLLGVVLPLIATAHGELTVAVTPGGLVVGQGPGDHYRIVRWSTVAGVEHRDGVLVFERHGLRPSLRFDAGAVDDPAAVVAAARRRLADTRDGVRGA